MRKRITTRHLISLCLVLFALVLILELNETRWRPTTLSRRMSRKNNINIEGIDCVLSASKIRQRDRTPKVKHSERGNHFYHPIKTNTIQDEKKCPDLYKIAREMLEGAKIKLPYETNNTRWKFRERVNLDILEKTNLHWNAPWKQGDTAETKKKLLHFNVTASSIKARKYLLTYGHNCCKESKQRAIEKAIEVAKVDYAAAFDLSALSIPFQISHSNVLRRRKGAGYWLWKPYLILKTMLTTLNNGDMLIYQDAGTYFMHDAGPLFKLCMEQKTNVLTFHMSYQESEYTKRDAFVLMGMDDPRVYKKGQTQRLGNLVVMMKTCETIQFVMEWLAYTSDSRISTDDKNVMGLPNFPKFKGHRHDQSVLSLLSKKWGILELRDPCTCGRNGFEKNFKYASAPYYQLYVHDRNRS